MWNVLSDAKQPVKRVRSRWKPMMTYATLCSDRWDRTAGDAIPCGTLRIYAKSTVSGRRSSFPKKNRSWESRFTTPVRFHGPREFRQSCAVARKRESRRIGA